MNNRKQLLRLKEEDYWVYAADTITVIFGAIALYASVTSFRLPFAVISIILMSITTLAVYKGYGLNYLKKHLLMLLLWIFSLLLIMYLLTK